MNLIFCDEGLKTGLQRLAGSSAIGDSGLWWKVFTNDVTPARDTVLADLTIDDTNFPAFELAAADLSTASLISDTQYIQGAVVNFTNGSGGALDVYGYAILDPSQTYVIAAARLDTAPTSVPAGGSLPVLPVLISRSQLP